MVDRGALGRVPKGAESIAVVGIGCRLPGSADSPDQFWDLLRCGRDTIGEVPAERWQWYAGRGHDFSAALRRAIKRGSFLTDIEGFDAEFFGLSSREAELMDPQQRILLEVAWEALEHAGIPPRTLGGSDTGVFIGVCTDDYGRRLMEDLPTIEAWTGIGWSMCAVANRISHVLDLRGPSLAVDTACSASLVSLHLACQSLRLRESTVALAGGVNLVVSPGPTLTLDYAGALAPDGRSKSFDATADGYGRGEGCGVVVLKRLADAQRDGDRVLAVILGSAVNQDGRTNGIMAPCGDAQEYVMRRACHDAGIAPSTVDYVEAHGTGTPLGDGMEATALSAVYGTGRDPDQPCLIGSVKSNIGHLEGAAGIAGVIKTVLALREAEIPPSVLATRQDPTFPWCDSGLRLVAARNPWPDRDRPRRAGVSAFGYGGTVAHLILEEAPDTARPPIGTEAAEQDRCLLFPLSARSDAALRGYAGALADWLSGQGGQVPLSSVAHTLALRRSHLSRRAVVAAADRPSLVARLRRLADGEADEGLTTGSEPPEPGKGLVWVFSGHGSQWIGMGRELLASEPRFGTVVDSLEPIFATEIGFSPRKAILDGSFDEVDRIQAMIFVMQIGLAEVWRGYGVTPDAVIGHSVGEIAAAVTSGALTLEDGARLACRRSALLRRVAGQGAMAMVSLPFHDVSGQLSGLNNLVAAISASPDSTVVSGDTAAVNAAVREWQRSGLAVRPVASEVAFHSPHMDPLLPALVSAAEDLACHPPRIPIYTTALEDPRLAPLRDAAYWAANLRNPVRFTDAITAAVQDGYRAFLEISPHPVVAHSIRETLFSTGVEDTFVGSSLRRNRPERQELLASIAAAHCQGISLDWTRLQPVGELVTLPPIRWQRRRHWRDPSPGTGGEGHQHEVDSHALLGSFTTVGGSSLRLWRTSLDDSNRPYPGSHAISGVEIIPAAVLLNTFVKAAAIDRAALALTDVSLQLPLMTAERREIHVVQEDTVLWLASRAVDDSAAYDPSWLVHTKALVTHDPKATELPSSFAEADGHRLDPVDPGLIRQRLAAVGVPATAFEWTIEELLRSDAALRGRVRAEQPRNGRATWGPPLDAATCIASAAFPGPPVQRTVVMVESVVIVGEPPENMLVEVTFDRHRDDTVNMLIADQDGNVVARVAGMRCPAISQMTTAVANPRQLAHEVVWRHVPAAPAQDDDAVSGDVVLVGTDITILDGLPERLAAAGRKCRAVSCPEELTSPETMLTHATDVIVVPPIARPDLALPEAALESAWLLTATVQQLAGRSTARQPRLWCVTTGVVGAQGSGLPQAVLWGLCRAIRAEHPELRCRVVDLDPDDNVAATDRLHTMMTVVASGESSAENGTTRDPSSDSTAAHALAMPTDALVAEDIVAIRAAKVLIPRLVRVGRPPARGSVECRADGTYLVTGGLGSFGLEVAHWLASRGARRIVLADIRRLPPRASWDLPTDEAVHQAIDRVRALEAIGVTVRVLQLDIADADQAARQLTPDALGLPPICGVVHCARFSQYRRATEIDREWLRAIMRPKVHGACVLHDLFPPGRLDFFVVFSSCAPLFGLQGHAADSAADAFLDALAVHRTATSFDDTLSLGWTSWRGKDPAADGELQARGVAAVSALEALATWDFAASRGSGYFAILRTLNLEKDTQLPPLLSEATPVDAGSKDAEFKAHENDSLSGLSPEQLREQLLAEVRSQIAAEMKISATDLDPRRSLIEQGVDSVLTVMVRRRLEKRFGYSLPTALLWHQPTVLAIVNHLAGLIAQPDEPGDNTTSVRLYGVLTPNPELSRRVRTCQIQRKGCQLEEGPIL